VGCLHTRGVSTAEGDSLSEIEIDCGPGRGNGSGQERQVEVGGKYWFVPSEKVRVTPDGLKVRCRLVDGLPILPGYPTKIGAVTEKTP
jgi:hypothetical protein